VKIPPNVFHTNRYDRSCRSFLHCDLIVIYNTGLGLVHIRHRNGVVRPILSNPRLVLVCCRVPRKRRRTVWGCKFACGGELQPTGATEPTRRFRPTLAHTHAHSNSFALSSPGPNISPYGLRLLAALDRPPPFLLPPSQHFNLSPLCRHPPGYKYRCQSSIPTFYPLQSPSPAIYHATGRVTPHPGHLTRYVFSFSLSLSLATQIADCAPTHRLSLQ
jgi:hypothetical protein